MRIFKIDTYGDRKSFYGKCQVIETGRYYVLQSYDTCVASYDKTTGVFSRHWYSYSVTTMRHVNAFVKFLGIPGGGKSWWESLDIVPCLGVLS
jgi:hypothetical protein